MRRAALLLSFPAAVRARGPRAGPGVATTAQDGSPSAGVGHPSAGTWLLALPDEPGTGTGPSLNPYTADGHAFQASPLRHGQGAWEATNERITVMTLVLFDPGERDRPGHGPGPRGPGG